MTGWQVDDQSLDCPWRTAVSLAAMTSRCQFIASSACGLSSWKQRAMKVVKSWRSSASYSERVRSSLRCYGLELDPIYVDTIIRRWQVLTGGSARHAASGRPFGDLAREAEAANAA